MKVVNGRKIGVQKLNYCFLFVEKSNYGEGI